MLLPIWIAARELDCCQPEATVGQRWRVDLISLRSPDPWWAKDAPEPVPDEVRSMGTVLLGAEVESVSVNGSGIASIGPGRVVLPDAPSPGPLELCGRLWVDGHEHFELRGAPELAVEGVVERIRGIRLIYEPVTVYLAVPVRQLDPIDLQSTAERNDPTADYGFSEFLIDLQI